MDAIKDKSVYDYLIGWRYDSAEYEVAAHKHVIRISVKDGEDQELKADWKPWRINVVVENDIITKIDGIY